MGITLQPNNSRRQMIPSSGIEMPTRTLFNPDAISFTEGCCTGCVGVIDMVNSTTTLASLPREKMAKYYSLFLNATTAIVRSFGGTVVKNVGDGLLYYFPLEEGANIESELAIWLECSIALVQFHRDINMKFALEGLPQVDYRVSLDYGELTLARSESSLCEDIFGTTVNMCAKINRLAERNGVVVGGDLHEMAKNLADYRFQLVGSHNLGFRAEYAVYSLGRKN